MSGWETGETNDAPSPTELGRPTLHHMASGVLLRPGLNRRTSDDSETGQRHNKV